MRDGGGRLEGVASTVRRLWGNEGRLSEAICFSTDSILGRRCDADCCYHGKIPKHYLIWELCGTVIHFLSVAKQLDILGGYKCSYHGHYPTSFRDVAYLSTLIVTEPCPPTDPPTLLASCVSSWRLEAYFLERQLQSISTCFRFPQTENTSKYYSCFRVVAHLEVHSIRFHRSVHVLHYDGAHHRGFWGARDALEYEDLSSR